ncbi:MAG: FkbM family methyltransferase, partial [Halobacteriaceae archaeon]
MSDFIEEIHAFLRTVNAETRCVNINGHQAQYYLHKYWPESHHNAFFEDEQPIINSLLSTLTTDDVFYDIGGHFGQYACLASAILPSEQVYTFEPDSFRQAIIRRNLSLNGRHVNIIGKALSDEEGIGPTPNITGDEFVEDGNPAPTVIKMDIEGSE